jgi:hypothetical protein
MKLLNFADYQTGTTGSADLSMFGNDVILLPNLTANRPDDYNIGHQ